MSARITAAERAALPVARAALEARDTAYGLAETVVFALGSAQLLQSPETAAELVRLRAEVYRLSLPVDDPDRHALDTADEAFAALAPGYPGGVVAQ